MKETLANSQSKQKKTKKTHKLNYKPYQQYPHAQKRKAAMYYIIDVSQMYHDTSVIQLLYNSWYVFGLRVF